MFKHDADTFCWSSIKENSDYEEFQKLLINVQKSDFYQIIMLKMIKNYSFKVMSCNMSLKVHKVHAHVDKLKKHESILRRTNRTFSSRLRMLQG